MNAVRLDFDIFITFCEYVFILDRIILLLFTPWRIGYIALHCYVTIKFEYATFSGSLKCCLSNNTKKVKKFCYIKSINYKKNAALWKRIAPQHKNATFLLQCKIKAQFSGWLKHFSHKKTLRKTECFIFSDFQAAWKMISSTPTIEIIYLPKAQRRF